MYMCLLPVDVVPISPSAVPLYQVTSTACIARRVSCYERRACPHEVSSARGHVISPPHMRHTPPPPPPRLHLHRPLTLHLTLHHTPPPYATSIRHLHSGDGLDAASPSTPQSQRSTERAKAQSRFNPRLNPRFKPTVHRTVHRRLNPRAAARRRGGAGRRHRQRRRG